MNTKIKAIQYKKHDGEVDSPVRYIIQTNDSTSNLIHAIDVTDVDEADRENIAKWYDEYTDYLNSVEQRTFSFGDWINHTYGIHRTIKWRSFTPSKVISQ